MFELCNTPEKAKQVYLQAVSNGCDVTEVTRLYLDKLKSFEGREFPVHTADGSKKSYRYEVKEGNENAFTKACQALVGLKMQGVELLVRGSWIWIEGDSKPYKDSLKALGCTFNSRRTKETGRGVWNWAPVKRNYRKRNNFTYQDIRSKYGEERLNG